MAIPMPAKDFAGFVESGSYLQLTLGRRLMEIEHFHDYYELICPLSGSCTHRVNGAELLQSVGELILLCPGDVHCFSSQSRDSSLFALSLLPELAEPFLRLFLSELPSQPIRTQLTSSELEVIRRYLDSALPRSDRTDILVRSILGVTLSALGASRITSGARERMPKSFADALIRMNDLENAAEGVSAFLRLSSFSHAQLCRLTKKHLGMTPGKYINRVRLRHARELIEDGRLSCEAVCELVGFESYSHFSHLFSEHFGLSPARARDEALLSSRTI